MRLGIEQAALTYAPIIVGGWLFFGIAVLLVMKVVGQEEWLLTAGSASRDTESYGSPNPSAEASPHVSVPATKGV